MILPCLRQSLNSLRSVAMLVTVIAFSGLPTTARSQGTGDMNSITGFEQGGPPPVSGAASGNGLEFTGGGDTTTYGNGPGWLFRVGHLTGPGYGRSESITPFELMPYLMDGDNIWFSDFRIFRANGSKLRMGGNMGVGFKHYVEQWNRTVGGAVYYDRDDLSDVTFEEITISAETLGEEFDLRGNVYLPTGKQTGLAKTDLLSNTVRFSSNNILYDQQRTIANAMQGFDAEIAVPVAGEWFQERDVKLAAGAYYFDASGVPDVVGWKGRLQGNVFPSLAMQVEVTSDDVFDTNVTFGVDWTYGAAKKPARRGGNVNQRYRLTEPIRRNYNITVASVPVIDQGLTAINPETGLPYSVLHVSNNPTSTIQTGSVDNPFEFISQAQTASLTTPTDIIYVHGGSTYSLAPNNSVALNTGDVILGEGLGVNHFIPISGFTTPLPLPRVNPDAVRPILTGASGDGVVMANNSRFSGFDIVSPTGNGITVSGVSDVRADNNRIFGAGGDGILVSNVSGPVEFQNTEVHNATQVGFHVTGGAPNVIFTSIAQQPGSGLITNNNDRAILIENMNGGFVNMTGSQVTDNGGSGILIRDVNNAAVTVDNASISNSPTTAIDIQRGNGVYTFRNTQNAATLIDNAGSVTGEPAFNIGGTSGLVSVSDLSITGRNGIGINMGLDDTSTNLFSGRAQFNGDVLVDVPNGGTGAGVLFDNSTGNATFLRNLTINSSGGVGFQVGGTRIANPTPITGMPPTIPVTTGSIAVNGGTLIDNSADTSLLIRDSSANVSFNGLTITNRNAAGIVIQDTMEIFNAAGNPLVDASGFPRSSVLTFGGITTINNTNGSTLSGIDIQRTDSSMNWGTVNVFDTTGDPGVRITDNSDPAFPALPSRSIDFGSLTVTSTGGTALEARNNPNLILGIGGGDITATTGNGVDIEDTGTAITLNSVTTTDAPSGIRLVRTTNPRNQVFNFAVVGDATQTLNGTGGTISSSDQAGQQGVFLEDAGSVLLQQMVFDANRTHVESFVTAANPNAGQTVQINYVQATNSTEEGLDFLDTDFVLINESLFNANGAATFDTMRFQVQTVNDYTWRIENNSITDATGNSIEIGPLLAATSDLTLNIQNNTITNTLAGDQQILLVWNGDVTGTIDNNTFTHTGGAANLIEIQTNSIVTTELASFDITSNEFTTTAGGDTGLLITTAGPSDFLIQNNTMTLGGGLAATQNRAMDFNLAGTSTTRLISNIVTDNTEGEGFVFTTIASPATVQIDDNQINILGFFGGLIERGIVFQAVSGQVNLVGTQNNAVNIANGGGPAVFFFMPPGTNIGQILVNGVLVP